MLDGPDDPMRDDPAPPRRMVVVHTRRGLMSRLAIPLLIAFVAVLILTYRVKLDDWRGVSSFLGETKPPADVVRPVSLPPSAVAVAVELPSPSVLSIPESRPSLYAGVLPSPMALRLSPMPAGPSSSPFPDRETKRVQAWLEIRRDVDQAKVDSAALEEIKRREFAEDQRLQPIREEESAREAMQATNESRTAFHRDLRRALADSRGKPGPAVAAVCEESGMNIGTSRRVVGTAAVPELTTTARRRRIEKMRSQGFTEPAILEDLARFESRNRAARGGPRSHQEVLVRAARQLLSVPLAAY